MSMDTSQEESGRIRLRVLAIRLVEQDIQTYGPIERTDAELEERTQYHAAHLLKAEPSPSLVADESEAFAHLYKTMYTGLLVGYTGLQEPFRLSVDPRYTTSVNLDDTEEEHPFVGLAGLRAILATTQASRRASAAVDESPLDAYLLTAVQVSIYDSEEEEEEKQAHYVNYDVDGDQILGYSERTQVTDEVLRGLGLPLKPTPEAAFSQKGHSQPHLRASD